jgi:hypothetical protein
VGVLLGSQTSGDDQGHDLGSAASMVIMAQRKTAPFAVPFTGIVNESG